MAKVEKLLFKENSVHVLLDNKELLSLSYEIYYEYGISSGDILQGELYTSLYLESEKNKSLNLAYRFLGIRNRSSYEMRVYLKKKQFPDDVIDETVAILVKKEYIDDYVFSKAFVNSRLRNGKYGKNLIIRDLYRKGIVKAIIDRVIDETDAKNADLEKLYELALKKYNQIINKKDPLFKVANYLKGRGFVFEDINKVLNLLKKENRKSEY